MNRDEKERVTQVVSPLSEIDAYDCRDSTVSSVLSDKLHRLSRNVRELRRKAIPSGGTSHQSFRYRPLPTATSIRLLRVLTITSPHDIEVHLETRDVRKKIYYNCLSYTWGNPTPSVPSTSRSSIETVDWSTPFIPIICNGRTLLLSRSLCEALWYISRSPANAQLSRIWIDAVCIDQQNPTEKAAQVLLMNDIYRLAQLVIVWVGPGSLDTKRALDTMRKLREVPQRRFRHAAGHHFEERNVYRRLGVVQIDNDDWNAVDAFFCRAWFGRAWIFQEAVLGRDLHVVCHYDIIPWDDIVHTSVFLNVSGWDTLIGRETNPQARNFTYGAGYISRSRDAVRENCGCGFLSEMATLDYFLERGRSLFRATDPRDMVYAVLGCSHPTIRDQIIPNYRKGVVDVYVEATWALLRCAGTLRVLTAVEDASRREIQGLPSWVPDYSVASYPTPLQGLFQDGDGAYRASARLTQNLKIPNLKSRVLHCTGMLYDSVVDIGETHEELFFGRSNKTSLDCILIPLALAIEGEKNAIEIFWRTLVGNTYDGFYPAPETVEDDFRAWVSWKVSSLLHEGKSKQACFETLQCLDNLSKIDEDQLLPSVEAIYDCPVKHIGWDLDPDATPEEFPGALRFDHESCMIMTGRRLIRTRNGLLGAGPLSMRLGDEIWIVPGVNVPLILRKVADDRYNLVGEAYVHGIMRGEAVNVWGVDLTELKLE